LGTGALFEKYRGMKVMVVDDQQIYHDILCSILDSLGFTWVAAFNGQAGLELYKQELPQLVISDIYMPKANGMMMARAINKIDPSTPIILMTGSMSENAIVFSPDLKIVSVILKPFKLVDMISAVEKALVYLDEIQAVESYPAVRKA